MYLANESVVKNDYNFAGMSSFYKGNDNLTEELIVNTITFDKIFELCDIESIDILKIDAEGYDLEILKMFPFNKIKPKFIQVEHQHIDFIQMQKLLSEQMYYWVSSERDTFAYYAGQ
jgi:FkbM family methyltransferase